MHFQYANVFDETLFVFDNEALGKCDVSNYSMTMMDTLMYVRHR